MLEYFYLGFTTPIRGRKWHCMNHYRMLTLSTWMISDGGVGGAPANNCYLRLTTKLKDAANKPKIDKNSQQKKHHSLCLPPEIQTSKFAKQNLFDQLCACACACCKCVRNVCTWVFLDVAIIGVLSIFIMSTGTWGAPQGATGVRGAPSRGQRVRLQLDARTPGRV